MRSPPTILPIRIRYGNTLKCLRPFFFDTKCNGIWEKLHKLFWTLLWSIVEKVSLPLGHAKEIFESFKVIECLVSFPRSSSIDNCKEKYSEENKRYQQTNDTTRYIENADTLYHSKKDKECDCIVSEQFPYLFQCLIKPFSFKVFCQIRT